MIFGLSWIFCGLSLMDCLWNSCGLLGMDFSLSLIGFPQPFVCVCGQVAQAMATGEMEELYWLLFFVYTLGFLSGILSAYCITRCCKSRNTTARNSGTVTKSSTALSCDSDGEGPGTRIYWGFCREMYHCSEKCEVLIAAASPNGHIRCRDNCQICQPETGPLLVVTSTGSKCWLWLQQDRSITVQVAVQRRSQSRWRCQHALSAMAWGMSRPSDWIRFEFESHKFERGREKSSYV